MIALHVVAIVSVAGLAATWLLYPLAVISIAALRRGKTFEPAPQPAITVLIATREPRSAVLERVSNILATDYRQDHLEVIVAHDGTLEDPEPDQLPGTGPVVRFVRADTPGGKAAALNAGFRVATGDIVVLADTYQRFGPGTIRELLRPFADPGVGAVTGSYHLAEEARGLVARYWAFERSLRRAEAEIHSPIGVTGAVYAVRRHLWRPLPIGLILDDLYVPMRLVLDGHRIAFATEALAYETRVTSARQEYGRKVRTLTGVLQLCAWLPAVLLPWRNPVWLQFLFHKLFRLLTPYLLLGVGIWIVALIPRIIGFRGFLGVAALVMALVGWLAVTRSTTGLRIRRIGIEICILMWAIVVATVNGFRGNWNVWKADAFNQSTALPAPTDKRSQEKTTSVLHDRE